MAVGSIGDVSGTKPNVGINARLAKTSKVGLKRRLVPVVLSSPALTPPRPVACFDPIAG